MMTTNTKHEQTVRTTSGTGRYLVVAALALVAFFGAYRYAVAGNSSGVGSEPTSGLGSIVAAASDAAGGQGGGCCGGGGAPVEGAATVEGDIQRISVDINGGYSPNVIKLRAGVPTEMTFAQSSGCTQWVVSSELGFQEDLASGPKTIKLQALTAGTYNFACGMDMVRGQIVVE